MSEHRFINQTLTVTSLIGLSLAGLVALCLFIAPAQRNATASVTDRAPASLVAGKTSETQESAGRYEKLSVGCEGLTRYSLATSVDRVMVVAQTCGKTLQESNATANELVNNSKPLAQTIPIIKNTTTEIEASVFKLEDGHVSSDLVTLTAGVNRIEIVQDSPSHPHRFIEITRLP